MGCSLSTLGTISPISSTVSLIVRGQEPCHSLASSRPSCFTHKNDAMSAHLLLAIVPVVSRLSFRSVMFLLVTSRLSLSRDAGSHLCSFDNGEPHNTVDNLKRSSISEMGLTRHVS